jgi:hypothetical protein
MSTLLNCPVSGKRRRGRKRIESPNTALTGNPTNVFVLT